MYKGRGWELSENHILYTLGHQSLLLKDHYTAASLFNELVSTTSNGNNPLQQMCHLREFFIVHHMREKEDKSVATITIPFFQAQQSLLDLSNDNLPYETLVDRVTSTSWQDLERSVIDTVSFHIGAKIQFYPKIHIFKISIFTKFIFLKSHFSQNSHF